MKYLLALLLSSVAFGQVQLTWVQPANPGWATSCGTGPCLRNYIITDQPTSATYTVPYGVLSFSPSASPGVHNYSIVLSGTNAAGASVSSTPPATTSVTVPLPNVLEVCPPGTVNTPTGVIAAGGLSKTVTYSCPGALASSSTQVGDSAVYSSAGAPPSQGGLVPYVWITANQINLVLANIGTRANNVTQSIPVTVRCIR